MSNAYMEKWCCHWCVWKSLTKSQVKKLLCIIFNACNNTPGIVMPHSPSTDFKCVRSEQYAAITIKWEWTLVVFHSRNLFFLQHNSKRREKTTRREIPRTMKLLLAFAFVVGCKMRSKPFLSLITFSISIRISNMKIWISNVRSLENNVYAHKHTYTVIHGILCQSMSWELSANGSSRRKMSSREKKCENISYRHCVVQLSTLYGCQPMSTMAVVLYIMTMLGCNHYYNISTPVLFTVLNDGTPLKVYNIAEGRRSNEDI